MGTWEFVYAGIVLAAILMIPFMMESPWIVFIPNGKFGYVFRKFNLGTRDERYQLISSNGSMGYHPRLLKSGLHFCIPFLETIAVESPVSVSQGDVAMMYSQLGKKPLDTTDVVYKEAFGNLEDIDAFIQNGGHQGLLTKVLTAGSYKLHPAAFLVLRRNCEPWGIPIPGSMFDTSLPQNKGKTSAQLMGSDIGEAIFNQRQQRITLTWEKERPISAPAKDLATISISLLVQGTLRRNGTPEVVRLFDGIRNLETQLCRITEEEAANVLQSRSAAEWLRYREDLRTQLQARLAPRFAAFNVSIEDCAINDMQIPKSIMEVREQAAVMGSKVPFYEAESEMQTMRGRAEHLRGIADSMENLGRTNVNVEISRLEQDVLKRWSDSLGPNATHLKFILDELNRTGVKPNGWSQFAMIVSPFAKSIAQELMTKGKFDPENFKEFVPQMEQMRDTMPASPLKEKFAAFLEELKKGI